MALTLQRKLELAGDLARVQPMLQRLHLVEKPKRRHRVRNVILVTGAIGAVTAVVVAVCCSRCCQNGDVAGNGGYEHARPQTEETPPTDFA